MKKILTTAPDAIWEPTKPSPAQIEAAMFGYSDIQWRDEMIRELRAEVKRLTAAAEVGEPEVERLRQQNAALLAALQALHPFIDIQRLPPAVAVLVAHAEDAAIRALKDK